MPAAYDEQEVTPLNEAWRVAPAAPPAGGLRGRLAHLVWRIVAPWLAQQEAFNARVVAHINNNVGHERELVASITSALQAIGQQAALLAGFHSHLVVFLQQITPYVDTKDRSVLGHLALVDEQAINAVADELLRRTEMMQVRDARFQAQVRALDAAHQEMRSGFATLYQATFTLKRELERLPGPPLGAVPSEADSSVAGLLPPRPPLPRGATAGPAPRSVRSTAGSTSASRISSAARAMKSAGGYPTTCRSSRVPATCSMPGAGVVSSWTCCARPASRRAGST